MMLPADFMVQMQRLLGEDECTRLCDALHTESPVSVRLNVSKTQAVGTLPIDRQVPWCSQGYYLSERPSFTFDPLFHAGMYYVQEASSMFLWHVLRQLTSDGQPVRLLDLCAAPGGKTTLAADALPCGSLVVANEIVKSRAQILKENVSKWGRCDVVVSNDESAAFTRLGTFFDIVVCDAPCSGEGMFRKDAGAIEEWSRDNVQMCQMRQRDILANAWQCLRPGGWLVYSTCTFNAEENEQNVDWIANHLGGEPMAVSMDAEWGISGCLDASLSIPCYRFMPHRTQGEGLFMAIIRKTDDADMRTINVQKPSRRRSKPALSSRLLNEAAAWVDTEHAELMTDEAGSMVSAFSKRHIDVLPLLKAHLHIIREGVEVAELKGNAHKGFSLQPAHSLAVSTCYRRGAFPEYEVDATQAIAYLRTESMVLPPDVPRGYVLLTFCGAPLGFVKNLGNRANNLYPSAWRILSQGR